MSTTKNLTKMCDEVHAVVEKATLNLTPPRDEQAALVRKKMSVFTFGICSVIAQREEADSEELYYRYLLKGGLRSHQARIVVERTRLEFMQNDYGRDCFAAGNLFASQQHNQAAKQIELNISELLLS